MGIFGKLKNIFYDEEIIEVPEKEVTPKVEEVVRPRIEEVKVEKKEEIVENKSESTYSERDLFKSEPTFKFPLIDEDDEDELPLRTRSRSNILEEKKESLTNRINETYANRDSHVNNNINSSQNNKYSSYNSTNTSRNEEKVFKPSPVISPVYGILDKNYKKEEIITKKEPIRRTSNVEINYDYIRKKAYGTLEDEFENTLTKLSEVNEDVETLVSEEDFESNSKSIEDLLSEIEENANLSIGEVEEKIKDEIEIKEEREELVEEIELNKDTELDINDKTLEHDLFNLIDSMYEGREDK